MIAHRHRDSCLGWFVVGCCFILVLLAPLPSLAQGCAMCKSTVAGQQANVTQTLNLGIVILLIPPLGIILAILLVAFKRDKTRQRSLRSRAMRGFGIT